MKSILYSSTPPFKTLPGIGMGRQEKTVTIRNNNRLYQLVIRGKIVPEDPYLVMVKATAFAIKQGEPYSASPVTRDVKDFLVKTNVIV